jgi:DNA-binding Lrp family transcriptional regulator
MEQHGISKLDLKRRNRMQVLKILKQRGPTSRIDIAGTLELTRAAVTIITNEMIEQGIIQEIGEYKHVTEKAPRGRKKILIDINHHYKFALGVTIEEDIVSVGLSTLSGAVLDKRNLPIDGKMQIGFALSRELRDQSYEFTRLKGKDVNTLVFPNLTSARSSYKMLQMLDADVEIIGPIQMGLNKPIHFIDFGASVRDVVNIVAVAVIDAYVEKIKSRIED